MRSTSESIEAGRSRAAFRVRQKLRSDNLKWSPSGKVRAATGSESRYRNRVLHLKQWNNRFMFDDESLSTEINGKIETRCAGGRVVTKYRAANVRKSLADAQKKPQKNRLEMEMKYFTERSNGEAVVDFCEPPPSSPDANRISIGLSPFDMTKVRAALEADCIEKSEIFRGANSISQIHPVKVNEDIETTNNEVPYQRQSHANGATLLLRIEELLHTIELEEALLRRDFCRNEVVEQKENEISSVNDEDKTSTSPSVLQEFWSETATQLPSVPIESRHRIFEYARKRFEEVGDRQQKVLTTNDQLQQPSVIARFAELIVDSIVEEIADELEYIISEAYRHIVSIL